MALFHRSTTSRSLSLMPVRDQRRMNEMKKKRTLKGMTLIEIIISMFILTVMAGLLLGIGLNVDETTKNTTGMK
ncbi:MAG: type II secretion system protein, partial [Ruminococcus sp.]|nr:type II secretion system protein [Ruminococcus sp.]